MLEKEIMGVGSVEYVNGHLNYYTTRNNRKHQIYNRKKVFISIDGQRYVGNNCIAISMDICRLLVSKKVKYIYFKVLNFPFPEMNSLRRIAVNDFLSKSVTIMEKGYDEQRIIAIAELEIVK